MSGGMGGWNGQSMMRGTYNRSWAASPPAMLGIMFNLPIPAALNNSTPSVVTATLEFGYPGHFWWWCAAPCDPVAMATTGYMRGSVTVT